MVRGLRAHNCVHSGTGQEGFLEEAELQLTLKDGEESMFMTQVLLSFANIFGLLPLATCTELALTLPTSAVPSFFCHRWALLLPNSSPLQESDI